MICLNDKTNDKTAGGIFSRITEASAKSAKIVFMGIGNFNRRDDAIGAHIVSSVIEGRLGVEDYKNSMRFSTPSGDKEVLLIAAATTPENFVDEIIDFSPGVIFYIDCADFSDASIKPGDMRIFYEDSLADPKAPVSTHSMSINLLIEIFKRKIPAAKNTFIGIKPENIDYDYSPDYFKNISPKVIGAGDAVIEYINGEVLPALEAV
ncbi:MAG TPA: hypothetical protein DC017_19075 [Candidatus Wallbacteria bacterium]|nr:hypothetical protein [Candidatus Wallbacteria bacterium]